MYLGFVKKVVVSSVVFSTLLGVCGSIGVLNVGFADASIRDVTYRVDLGTTKPLSDKEPIDNKALRVKMKGKSYGSKNKVTSILNVSYTSGMYMPGKYEAVYYKKSVSGEYDIYGNSYGDARLGKSEFGLPFGIDPGKYYIRIKAYKYYKGSNKKTYVDFISKTRSFVVTDSGDVK